MASTQKKNRIFKEMTNVIITGATGMIGKIILGECIKSPDIHLVTSLVRRPSGLEHPKLREVVINDFVTYDDKKELFKYQHMAFYCLGVYTGKVDRKEFRKITVDYTKGFADQLYQQSPDCTVCFLSGAGADPTEMSRMMFAKDKGAAENYLLARSFNDLHIFRPAYIYPIKKRDEPNLMYKIMRSLYPLMRKFYPRGVITSDQLAEAMFFTGQYGSGKNIYENEEIKELVGTADVS